MTKATYFVKPGAWAASSVPLRTQNTAYAVGAIVREPSSDYVIICTVAGNTGTGAYSIPVGTPESEVAVGTSSWRLATGEGGLVADTWDIANSTIYHAVVSGSTYLSSGWYYGRLYDEGNGDSSILYLASNAVLPGYALRDDGLCTQAYHGESMIYSGNYGRLIGFPNGMPFDLRVISADEAITAPVHGTFKAGATFNLDPATEYSYLAGRNYLKGITFNAASTQFRISFFVPFIGTRGIQFAAINVFDQCVINLSTDPVYPSTPATLKLAAVWYSQNAKERNPAIPYSQDSSGGLGEAMRTTFSKTIINVDNAWAYIGISSDAEFYETTINVTSCAAAGLLVFNEGENAGDIEVRMAGVVFSGPITRLLADRSTGRATVTLDGCGLPTNDLDSLFWTLPPTAMATITFHVMESGLSGGITPHSYSYYTNRVKAVKTNGVYRDGSLPDAGGGAHSYYVQTKDVGLTPLSAFDELPHLSRVVDAGDFEVRLLVAVPPDQLLYDDELFAQFIGPDLGTETGVTPWTAPPLYAEGTYAANTAWCRRRTLREDRKQHPVVAASWTGIPAGWVTQALSVLLPLPASGRIHCIPMVAKNGAQFILCPTLDLLQVA